MKSLWFIMIATIVIILLIFFYAFFFLPMYEAPSVANDIQKETPSESFEDGAADKDDMREDTVLFAFNRNYPKSMQEVLLEHNGMDDVNQLEQNVKKQYYTEILKALWSEGDHTKKLEWLRKKRIESHPILLFELAVEEIQNDSSIKGFEESLFLLELGKYRTAMDAACVKDSSAQAAAESLYNTYSMVVAAEVRKNPELLKEISGSSSSSVSLVVLQRLIEALKEIKENLNTLPSARWVSYHALKMLFVNNELLMEKDKCEAKQKQLIDADIKTMQKQVDKFPKEKS